MLKTCPVLGLISVRRLVLLVIPYQRAHVLSGRLCLTQVAVAVNPVLPPIWFSPPPPPPRTLSGRLSQWWMSSARSAFTVGARRQHGHPNGQLHRARWPLAEYSRLGWREKTFLGSHALLAEDSVGGSGRAPTHLCGPCPVPLRAFRGPQSNPASRVWRDWVLSRSWRNYGAIW